MKFKNLTPHVVKILNKDFTEKIVIAPEEGVLPLRVQSSNEVVGMIDGIQITKTVFGKCKELPEAENGTYFIVSRLVISAHPERNDLLSPNHMVKRDTDGNISCSPYAKGEIIGCLSLSI